MIGVCAIGGFYGTYKLSQILNEKDEIKKQHPIPDMLLMDYDIEFSFSKFKTDLILNHAFKKTHMPGGDFTKLDTLPISGFFYENLFNTNTHARDLFALDQSIYNDLKQQSIVGRAYSKDGTTMISFTTNNNEIRIGTKDNTHDKDTYFEVYSYNQTTKTFHGKLINVQLMIESASKSQYLLDLTEIQYMVFGGAEIKIKEVKNVLLKTYKTKYFRLKNNQIGEDGFYHAILVQTPV